MFANLVCCGQVVQRVEPDRCNNIDWLVQLHFLYLVYNFSFITVSRYRLLCISNEYTPYPNE